MGVVRLKQMEDYLVISPNCGVQAEKSGEQFEKWGVQEAKAVRWM